VATVSEPAVDERLHDELERTWRRHTGFWGWLTSVDHKSIGKRYIVTAFIFFILGGLNAALMRAQLARPENNLVGPDLYNQLFSVHGTTMMFLFAVPIMTAMGIYFVPLMVGARNIAFPRLNAYGYWVYLIGGSLLYIALFTNTGPEAGWFNYVPLAGPEFSPGKRTDVYAQTVTFTEIAALIGASCAGHDTGANAAFCVGAARDRLHDSVRDALGRHSEPDAGDGPADRNALLQPGRRRRRPAVAAPLLVLRTP
jgi:hypothetical protein